MNKKQDSKSSNSTKWSDILDYGVETDEDKPIWTKQVAKETETASLFSSSNNSETGETELEESEKFYSKLAAAVRSYPCLYDPGDKCYRTNEKYRRECWAQVATRINHRGDIVPLSKQWINLREVYREWRRNNLEDPKIKGQFPILFASMGWLDRHIIPLYERIPLFAALVKMHNHVLSQKEIAEERETRWKKSDKSKETTKTKGEKDIYDISFDSKTSQKDTEEIRKTPKRVKKKILMPYSTPRRPARSHRPVIESSEESL